ncbi:hydrolase Nlp/P60 [Lacrimispora algidixylanolytica]|uniref:Hydrolase Nlp/P60 n=2 Tax=Lacrimispora algidixylanolytica TaxID=94868 RepID=A0A419SSN5_9FIRM|nr:hydrolase Nlp/P60 [Lacrimispora algidixylanolytica]
MERKYRMDNKDENKDYVVRLDKARKSRSKNDYKKYFMIGGAGVLLVAGVIAAGAAVKRGSVAPVALATASEATNQSDSKNIDGAAKASEEAIKQAEESKKVLASYKNLGIVKASGYLNIRKNPGTDGDVIGKLQGDGACDVLEKTADGWYKITSGGIEGYINSEYVITGEEATKKAETLVKLRAVVKADSMNIRKEPSKSSDSVGQALADERFEVLDQTDGWVKISSGYLSSDYVTLEYSLNEARKLDLKAMVFNYYKNLGISNVDNFLNVREEPNEKGKVIAKMPSKAAGEILETTTDGWYKIQSGSITGYVKSDYIITGQPAKDEAMQVAQLMAIVNTDMLNARSEPSTDSKIWTQVSNNERYPVLKQIDGWVQIELEEDSNAYVATDFVDVRYSLPQAIKFSPLEEKNNAQASKRTQIVNYALQFLGNPYVWGGTSLTKGADCSGFTMSVYSKFGVGLPHYSGSQGGMGTSVKSSDMKPGDLLFYASSKGTINHVAMYIGNGQIVHAASRRSGIKISSWNYRSPVKIRNMLGD